MRRATIIDDPSSSTPPRFLADAFPVSTSVAGSEPSSGLTSGRRPDDSSGAPPRCVSCHPPHRKAVPHIRVRGGYDSSPPTVLRCEPGHSAPPTQRILTMPNSDTSLSEWRISRDLRGISPLQQTKVFYAIQLFLLVGLLIPSKDGEATKVWLGLAAFSVAATWWYGITTHFVINPRDGAIKVAWSLLNTVPVWTTTLPLQRNAVASVDS